MQSWSISAEWLAYLAFPLMPPLMARVGGARALVVVSPNNPTGTAPGAATFAELSALCRRAGAALVVDQVFAPYGPRGQRVSLPHATSQ